MVGPLHPGSFGWKMTDDLVRAMEEMNMSMKCTGTILLVLLSVILSFSLLSAGDGNPEGRSGKVKITLMEVENKSGPNLGSEWNFLKRDKGPYSSNPLGSGLGERLAEALMQTERFDVMDRMVLRAPVSPGAGPHFLVFTDFTLHEDHVTVEVRLADPRTMKLIKAKVVEGRPEDLSRLHPAAASEENPAEKAVQAAIIKAVKWIEENTLVEANPPRRPEWVPTVPTVVVKASAANIKEGPSIQSATLITVRQGTMLEKVGEEGSWVKVKLESGEMGWIYGDLVEQSLTSQKQ